MKTVKTNIFKRINRWRIKKGRQWRNWRKLEIFYIKKERKRRRYPLTELPSCKTVAIMMLGSGIGDSIVMSGFINALRQAGKKVYILCTAKLLVMDGIIETDGFYGLPDKPKQKNVQKFNFNFDAVICFTDPDKNTHRDICVLTSIGHKWAIGFNQKDKRFWDLNIVRNDLNQHWSERLIEGAKYLGVGIENYRYDLHFSYECSKEVNSFIERNNLDNFVIVNPTASDKFRSLSLSFVRDTLNWIKSNLISKVIVYNVKDVALINEFPDVIFNPFNRLDCCIELIGKCKFLITVDTSFIHAANFFNTPMIGIYNNRLAAGKYNNNVQWGPHYQGGGQVFSIDYDNTETGDDLRKLPFYVLEQGLMCCTTLKPLTKNK